MSFTVVRFARFRLGIVPLTSWIGNSLNGAPENSTVIPVRELAKIAVPELLKSLSAIYRNPVRELPKHAFTIAAQLLRATRHESIQILVILFALAGSALAGPFGPPGPPRGPPGPPRASGAAGPMGLAIFAILAVGYGVYWLVRRRVAKLNRNCCGPAQS
jgi:hypothetical protein